MQSQIWASTIPLWITHASSPIPFIVHFPRLSYLPLLLPRLSSVLGLEHTDGAVFLYEGIEMTVLPVGLLFDLYAPELPWRLELELKEGGVSWDVRDAWMNSVKEADFLRNGTAKGIMSMSKGDSTQLWNAVQDNDLKSFNAIHSKLLNPATPLRHIPLRIYIPTAPSTSPASSTTRGALITSSATPEAASFKVVQALVTPRNPNNRDIQTLGSALHSIIPSLFPSTRDAILAEPVLHGAVVPFKAELEVLMREATYADGWLHLCINMLA